MYKDKVVVITGGSQGIGQHLALAYLEQQAKVIVLDIAPNMNPDMDFHLVDLGRPEQIEQALMRSKESTAKSMFSSTMVRSPTLTNPFSS